MTTTTIELTLEEVTILAILLDGNTMSNPAIQNYISCSGVGERFTKRYEALTNVRYKVNDELDVMEMEQFTTKEKEWSLKECSSRYNPETGEWEEAATYMAFP
jgi:hypothetical protein